MYRLVILGLVCLSNILWAQKSMVLEVSTDSLLTNDPFEITITVENINSPSIPELPIGEGLKLVSGPNLSQSMRSINGLQTTTTSVSYVLFAAEPMVYEIEPLRIEDAGESFSTEPMTLIIQETRRVCSGGRLSKSRQYSHSTFLTNLTIHIKLQKRNLRNEK
jgi:hypothetical protein